MRSSPLLAAAALALLPATPSAAAPNGGPCVEPAGGAAVLVHVTGFKDRQGQVRVQLYRALESDFLVSGRYAARVDTPTAAAGVMHVCVKLPEPGDYAVAILHDRNSNGKLDVFGGDGAGFGNNPRLRLGKPSLDQVRVRLPAGVTELTVRLNYLRGLRVGPVEERVAG